MGIFSKKDQNHKQPQESQAQAVAEDIFDENYKQQLKELGKAHFQSLIDEHSADMSKGIKTLTDGLKDELKVYAAAQLNLTLSKISKDISDQVNQQITEYHQTSSRAQELATQSLNQSAQAVFAKYQQMTKDLSQTVSDQERMMVGVFQDNKSHVVELKAEQDKMLKELSHNIHETQQQTESLGQTMKTAIADQTSKLTTIYQENITEVNKVKASQDAAIKTLAESVSNIEQQHLQLKQLMDTALVKQKTLISSVVNQHMSKIVEHYLVTALGDNSDITAQLPSILEKLNASKEAMQEDMKL